MGLDELSSVKEKCVLVRKVLDDSDKLSTESKPYQIKYDAIKILKEMETDLKKALESDDKREEALIMLAIVHLNLGILHADTEELKAGEENLMKCIELLKDKELEADAVLPVLSALNQLGIIWSLWSQPSKAKGFLDKAEKIYEDFIKDGSKEPVNMAANFGIEDVKDELSGKDVMEKIHTLTLYYLAQVYGSLKDHHKSAVYCHMTLRRQLGNTDIVEGLDYIDWALNAATLSQYFLENDGFTQARHHLAAASFILNKYDAILKRKLEMDGESEELTAELEKFKHRSADVARCWAKYGIMLMSLSKERLLQKAEKDDEEKSSESKDTSNANSFENLKFDVLEKELRPIAYQITDKYLLDEEDARHVLKNVLKWLRQAKMYYTLQDHASDYVLLVQDMSQAYKYMTFFEHSESKQAQFHEERIKILQEVIKELNPQYYKSACSQIWLELGETYSDLLGIKMDASRTSNERLEGPSITKINSLVKSAIQNFKLFLDSLEICKTSTSKEPFPEDLMQRALFAYFYLGTLYSKHITFDKKEQLENLHNSINAYKFIVDYCEKRPKAAELIKVELNLCKELVELLPLKINELRHQIEDSEQDD